MMRKHRDILPAPLDIDVEYITPWQRNLSELGRAIGRLAGVGALVWVGFWILNGGIL